MREVSPTTNTRFLANASGSDASADYGAPHHAIRLVLGALEDFICSCTLALGAFYRNTDAASWEGCKNAPPLGDCAAFGQTLQNTLSHSVARNVGYLERVMGRRCVAVDRRCTHKEVDAHAHCRYGNASSSSSRITLPTFSLCTEQSHAPQLESNFPTAHMRALLRTRGRARSHGHAQENQGHGHCQNWQP
jgi:hypothetical protein